MYVACSNLNNAVAQCVSVSQPMQEGSVPGSYAQGSWDRRPVRIALNKPSNYCLSGNVHIDGQYRPFTPEGNRLLSDDDQIITVNADNITLDFKGNIATSDARLLAGLSTPIERKYTIVNHPLPKIVPNNITIKNGTIKLERTGTGIHIRGVGPEYFANTTVELKDVIIGSTWDAVERDEYQKDTGVRIRLLSEMFPTGPSAYPVRNLHVENMSVRTREYAVVLEGASTVIKNSEIETVSGTAIWLYGPNAVLENNTIIVHCQEAAPTTSTSASYCKDMDAPIRLMHGDGAIIRNNRFILKDKAHQRVISVFETDNFTFENNTIVGLKDLKDTAKAFTGTLQMKGNGNRIVTSKEEAYNIERMSPTNIGTSSNRDLWSTVKSWFNW
jgi:Right handed beta helix region